MAYRKVNIYLKPKQVVGKIVTTVTILKNDEMIRKRKIKEKRKLRQEKLNNITDLEK